MLLRQFTAFARFQNCRFLASKTLANCNNKKITKGMNPGKQIHEETLRYIDPYAKIIIRSDIFLNIRPADVLEYPNGNILIAELHGSSNVRNATAGMKIHISDDEKEVNVDLTKLIEPTDFHCELKVPVRASLDIITKDAVNIEKIFGDEVNVKAQKQITLSDIKAPLVTLNSTCGHIHSNGLLLAQNATIETKEKGGIFLDKLQGNNLSCITVDGDIRTNSCYVETSKFETNCGDLQLKNVHKTSQVYVKKKGDINMTGVHGNVYVRSNGGKMNLQFSELAGENIIMGNSIENAVINISDTIEENSYIEITSSPIVLDTSLSHLADCISTDKTSFRMSQEQDNQNKLMICINGGVKFGKLSWADSLKATLGLLEK